MLQTVLGIDAARIASAFLVSPASMSQRLVRAKNKFVTPEFLFAYPNLQNWRNGFRLFSMLFTRLTRPAGKA
jgi:RNA polymerase sigma-70 factor, ECF subfamily